MNTYLVKSVVGRVSKFLFLSLFCCFFVGSVNAQFIFLGTSPSNNDWSTAENWQGGNVPENGATDISIIIGANVVVDVPSWSIGSGSTMVIYSGTTVTFGTGTVQSFTNNGKIDNLGTVMTANDAQFENKGLFINQGVLIPSPASSFINDGTLNNHATGDITILGAFTNSISGSISNAGRLFISTSTASFACSGALNNNGTITRSAGSISFFGDGFSISGAGTIDMNGDELSLSNGTLSPGNSFGSMNIIGTMVLSGMTINIEVGGDGPEYHDTIAVTGSLTLDSGNTLNMLYGPGYFDINENWVVIDVTGILSGTFDTETDFPPPSEPTATLTASYPANTVVITHSGIAFLPVELSSFSGEVIDNSIELNWSTANELNNDYMIVERSANGLDFIDVGRVDGKGTTSEAQAYSFLDQAPLNGLNYYRLRQVDIDGTEHQSNVIVIDMDLDIQDLRLTAYPNPTQDQLRVVWQSPATADDGSIQLIEASSGKILQRFAMPEGTNMMEIPVQDLPSGLYVIQVVQADQRKAIQFMKN